MSQSTPERTIVVGLDGAGFDLLDPWISEGELPTLLHLHGKEVPPGMDGRVRRSVFAAGSPTTHRSHSDTGH